MPSLSREHVPVLERPARQRLVVLTEAMAAPGWAETWCRQGDRPLATHQVATHSPHGAPTGLLRVITDLAGHHVLLTRATDPQTAPNRVVAALGRLPRDWAVLAEAQACARHLDVPLTLVHGVPMAFAERSVGLDDALEHGQGLLEAAEQRVSAGSPSLDVTSRLVRARAHELVTEIADTDLLVLGMSHDPTCPAPHLAGMSAIHYAPGTILFVPTS